MRASLCLVLLFASACAVDHALPVVEQTPAVEAPTDLGKVVSVDAGVAPADLAEAAPVCPKQDVPESVIAESCAEMAGCCSSGNGVAELDGCGTAPFTWVCFHGRCCHPRNGVTDLGQ